jgi:hypothetical protein
MADTADSRAAILEAAKLLFMQDGFRGISMRQIAEAVGVTKAALYYHFKDKEQGTLFGDVPRTLRRPYHHASAGWHGTRRVAEGECQCCNLGATWHDVPLFPPRSPFTGPAHADIDPRVAGDLFRRTRVTLLPGQLTSLVTKQLSKIVLPTCMTPG